jgi:hypothetical protein
MIKESQTLGVRFELPDRLTVGEMDAYQSAIQTAIEQNGLTASNLTDMRYFALVHVVANQCGLIRKWQSETMPNPTPDDVDEADAAVIYFTGVSVRDYIRSFTDIAPKSSWPPPGAVAPPVST